MRKMDFLGSIDPFIHVDYVHQKETKVLKNNQRPRWKEEIKVTLDFVSICLTLLLDSGLTTMCCQEDKAHSF